MTSEAYAESTAVVYPTVTLGIESTIGHFVILGALPAGQNAAAFQTTIGAGAVIRSHSVIYAGNVIGSKFQTGHHVLIRELNQIGDDVSIGTHTVIEHHIRIGSRVRIHSNVFIPEYSELEDDSWVGPNVVFTNALYPRSADVKAHLKGPHLLPGAKIGANVTLLPGVVIGRNALIGAGSVVTGDVPDNKVVVGNPGRIIKDVTDLNAYEVLQLIDRRNG